MEAIRESKARQYYGDAQAHLRLNVLDAIVVVVLRCEVCILFKKKGEKK